MSYALLTLDLIREKLPGPVPHGAEVEAVKEHTDCPSCDGTIGTWCRGLPLRQLHRDRVDTFLQVVLPALTGTAAPPREPAAPRTQSTTAQRYHATPRGYRCTATPAPLEGAGGQQIGWHCGRCGAALRLDDPAAPERRAA